MNLPAPIQTYFAARPPGDSSKLAAAFAPDAVVQDEGQTLHSPGQIAPWWEAAKQKYDHTAEPLEMAEDAGTTIVRARVTGNFPGSPAVLTFRFTLDGERISRLAIG
ncbi:nuclear transport factor 2 family protein [Pelagovum pacificum]|uniref:Nuclear transport factor 2 family protein n=1 Tax=Pelagovum pacificum TaxID=2588711 RepID=A0A5C5GLC1_9RHOB|nr:nuclear transport factor 2 family protein [Pelagovum pacificum]QQA42693.1 nuclear transport factor 2 family protein [Pelagovum pacificum]TNY34156.1 nuclear transport factor 2 family protein [Pelagovum pacificum]